MFLTLKNYLIERFIGYFEAPVAGVLFAMFFGDDRALSSSISHSFGIIGMQHVMVASGYNIGLMLGLGKATLGRFWGLGKALCLVGILILYVVIAGTSPSLIRACLQASTMVFATYVAKVKVPAVWALSTTIVLVFVFAVSLISEVSFQLSVLSTLAVLLAETVIPLTTVKDSWFKTMFIETAQLTTVVQLVTFPVTWYYFGSVSLLTLPANTLLLWLTPFLTYLALYAAALALLEKLFPFFLYWLPLSFLLKVLGWLLSTPFLFSIKFMAQWESSVIKLPAFQWQYGVCWYGLLCAYLLKVLRKRRKIYQGLV